MFCPLATMSWKGGMGIRRPGWIMCPTGRKFAPDLAGNCAELAQQLIADGSIEGLFRQE